CCSKFCIFGVVFLMHRGDLLRVLLFVDLLLVILRVRMFERIQFLIVPVLHRLELLVCWRDSSCCCSRRCAVQVLRFTDCADLKGCAARPRAAGPAQVAPAGANPDASPGSSRGPWPSTSSHFQRAQRTAMQRSSFPRLFGPHSARSSALLAF